MIEGSTKTYRIREAANRHEIDAANTIVVEFDIFPIPLILLRR